MLFVFKTFDPSKDLLRIVSRASGTIIQNEILNLPLLEEAIRSCCELPSEGTLHYMCKIDNIVVLSWDFKNFTPCRQATIENFGDVLQFERSFEFTSKCPKGTVSMPYFVIQDKDSDIFDNPNDPGQSTVRDEYLYPNVSEAIRIEALYKSLTSNQYNVKKIDPVKTVNHLCEFSGGGDIYINVHNSSPLIVFVPNESAPEDQDPPVDQDPTLDQDPPVDQDPTLDQDPTVDQDLNSQATGDAPEGSATQLSVSPLASGCSKLVSLCLEGKKDSSFDVDKLKFQLWANMVVIAIKEFSESVCNLYTKKLDLLALSQLSVYGIGCSGSGILGVYKLEMDLKKRETRFVTKLKIGYRDRIQAAALMDFTLQYYKKVAVRNCQS